MNAKASRRVLARTMAAKLLAEPDKRQHWVKLLAAYLMDHGMDDDVDLVINDIAHELYLQSGHLIVEVTSARELSGSTREELEAAAAEYLADHPPANGNGPAPTKPVEDLRGGGEPAEGPEPDIRKIVDSIPRGI